MKLIKLTRQYSTNELYINEDAIDSLYEEYNSTIEKMDFHILLRSRITYDISKNCYLALVNRKKG